MSESLTNGRPTGLVNVWSPLNRGDLAIALGTAELWVGSDDEAEDFSVSMMDGRATDLSTLRSWAQRRFTPTATSSRQVREAVKDAGMLARWFLARSDVSAGAPQLLVAVGGHYLKTASIRPKADVRMRRLLMPVKPAVRNGGAVIFWGHSLGPFGSPAVARPLVELVNMGGVMACREELSCSIASDMGIAEDRIFQVADPAFHLTPVTDERVSELLDDIDLVQGEYVAVSIRRPESRLTTDGAYRRYLSELVKVLEALSRERQVVMIAQCIGPTHAENDYLALQELRALRDSWKNVRWLPGALSLEQTRSIYAGASSILATRLHAAILGFVQGTPAVGISYSGPKTPGVFRSLQLQDFVTTYEDVQADWVLEHLRTLNDNRAPLATQVRRLVAEQVELTKTQKLLALAQVSHSARTERQASRV